ncbi:MAG: SpoIID/LytB domain-containing protein [Calditrichae bacterium]|nr:SpoIID/LytB domain-containing protein [Calditrichia bacterium]
MLIPNHTPETEPTINVGIILPEDNITNINLTFPGQSGYDLIADGKQYSIETGSALSVTLDVNGISCRINHDEIIAAEFVFSSKESTADPKTKSGIKAGPVIAGRGFHWQKNIEVFLPDTIILRIVNDKLILINQLPLEHYVMCVSTSEMSAACPEAMIEAQTIAARSWLLANVEQKHRDLDMDVCNDDCCQRYQGTTYLSQQSVRGALNTNGQVLLYNNKICDARYSKSCGGMMETFGAIWPGHEEDYMKNIPDSKHPLPDLKTPLSSESNVDSWIQAVPDTFCSPHTINESELKKYLGNVDEEGSYFRWQISLTNQEISQSLQKYAGLDVSEIISFKVLSRGGSGRINKLEVVYSDSSGKMKVFTIDSEYNVRRFLSDKFLYSSAIVISSAKKKGDKTSIFQIKGAGWGHGVGLCQIGALGMSLKGYQTSEILYHYYPGSHLKKIY